MSRFKSLSIRVMVAIPGMGLFLTVALVNSRILTAGFFGLIAMLAAFEAIALLEAGASPIQKIVGGFLTGGATVGISILNPVLSIPMLLVPGAVVSLWLVFSSGVENSAGRVAGSFGLLMILAVGFGLMARFRLDFQSLWVLFIPLFICWISDSLAYFIGSAFGKHKMAPGISPNKSWEGFAAGLIGAVAGALIAGTLGAGFPIALMVVAGILAGLAAVAGDLLESSLKRSAGVKDSGNMLPGHGGILDRFDSILAAAPVVWALLMLYQIEGFPI